MPIDLLAGEERHGLLPQMPEGPSVARRVHLKKADFEEQSVRKWCQGNDTLHRGDVCSSQRNERRRERMEKEMGATAEGASRVDRAAKRRSDTDAERRGKRSKLAEEVPKSDAAAAAVAAKGEGGPEADSAVREDETIEGAAASSSAARSAIEGAAASSSAARVAIEGATAPSSAAREAIEGAAASSSAAREAIEGAAASSSAARSSGAEYEVEDQLQLGFRMIEKAFCAKVQALEHEAKSLRISCEEQKQQAAGLQRKSSGLEVELVEGHQRSLITGTYA
jgi:hypothetical protein